MVVIGGTAAGTALKDVSMGKTGDAISGAVGGSIVGQILMAVLNGAAAPDAAGAVAGMDIGGIVNDATLRIGVSHLIPPKSVRTVPS